MVKKIRLRTVQMHSFGASRLTTDWLLSLALLRSNLDSTGQSYDSLLQRFASVKSFRVKFVVINNNFENMYKFVNIVRDSRGFIHWLSYQRGFEVSVCISCGCLGTIEFDRK